ncbi:MAG: DUF4430 domain-containing protein [Pirellulaceae bacterium]
MPKISVRYSIEFLGKRDDVQKTIDVDSGTTVFAGLFQAIQPETVVYSGSGETCFVKSICGQANEGAGGANWTYRVNDEVIKKSSDVQILNDGDHVSWQLGSKTVLQ